jgi:hypothetical protein
MKREYKFLLLAILIFLGAELLLDYYLDGSSLEVKLLLAVTLFVICNVCATHVKHSS